MPKRFRTGGGWPGPGSVYRGYGEEASAKAAAAPLHQQGLLGAIPAGTGMLAQRFGHPPFSVWDTRSGEWQARKRLWIDSYGIKSEVGRDAAAYAQDGLNTLTAQMAASRKLAPGGEGGPNSAYRNMRGGHKPVYNMTTRNGGSQYGRVGEGDGMATGTSIFDPVVCELAYRFWCPPGGVILDPFAGGSVRGIVASLLGYQYRGIELRQVQVDANRAQVTPRNTGAHAPAWRQGDSALVLPTLPVQCVDYLFSCPPYGNLEVYSDLPGDVSAMDYNAFSAAYTQIIRMACDRLRPNAFACWVVGNYREGGGPLRDLVGLTTQAFAAAGLAWWNDVVLVGAVGTAAARANTSYVRGACKLVKTHQNVLVYVKGDPKLAAAKIPRDDGQGGKK